MRMDFPKKSPSVHVRGHRGEPGNEAADRLANEGAVKPKIKLSVFCSQVHVRGHRGEPGNEAADRLANEGAVKPKIKL